MSRKIHFPSEVWEYRVGKSCVVIFSPGKRKHIVNKCDLVGMPYYEYENMKAKGGDVEITPSIIKKHIEDVIWGKLVPNAQ